MKKAIQTSNAPKAIGPYSQAIVSTFSSLIFVSGQLPIDPSTGKMIEGNIQTLTRQTLKNIEAILIAANSSIQHILKIELFLADMNDFASVNEIFNEFFTVPPFPARQTIQVAKLPLNARIEISCIAGIPSSSH